MFRKYLASSFGIGSLVVAALAVGFPAHMGAQDAAVVAKIIQLGQTDNQVMTWNDFASNRFGGRESGTNAYNDATAWAAWQFKQWGFDVELDEAGEVPVGFNRGPWFGKMTKPSTKPLRFGTPSFTAGTKGVQRGPVVILKANPFSIPGRNAKPEDVEKKRAAVQAAIAEVNANKSAYKGAWVLIGGASTGFARDGRRNTPEYSDAQLIPLLTKALVDAGALGTIQSATPPSPAQPGNSEPPLSILDGNVESWARLPVLPDIKLLNTQFDEITAMVEKKQPVELEFDIRNWFKMGPIKYHNVVATLRGTIIPDEYVVIGGHFDCFSGATGGVDDGSGFAPGMEAVRLIKAAGGRPKRSLIFIAFAAEESGLVGSQGWLKRHPELHGKIVMMINRDGSPSAVTGARVPTAWYADFQQITAPLTNLNAKWPFKLEPNDYPSARPERPGGTDSSSFAMVGVPTLNFTSTSARPGPDGKEINYSYGYAWHTLNDLYSELVPYSEYQQHSALATAVVAYGVANLDKPLTRDGVYLPDGLYADIVFKQGDVDKRVMASLDFVNAPAHTANFIRLGEKEMAAQAAKMPPAPAGGPGGPGGFGGPRPVGPPIGKVLVAKGGSFNGQLGDAPAKGTVVLKLPKVSNPALKHVGPGILGITTANQFYVTTAKQPGFDKKYTAIGKVIAGTGQVDQVKLGDNIQSIRFVRVGQAAKDFKTDDEAFKALLQPAPKKK